MTRGLPCSPACAALFLLRPAQIAHHSVPALQLNVKNKMAPCGARKSRQPFRSNSNRASCHFTPTLWNNSAIDHARSSAMERLPMFIGKLLSPVDNGLNFHQTRESAAETARIGITEEFCDVGQGLARVPEELGKPYSSEPPQALRGSLFPYGRDDAATSACRSCRRGLYHLWLRHRVAATRQWPRGPPRTKANGRLSSVGVGHEVYAPSREYQMLEGHGYSGSRVADCPGKSGICRSRSSSRSTLSSARNIARIW
ncbi:hypothetical protein ACVIHI_006950 [Bradyrhizobium sp. USDA 4524]|nr:hypothetical protein [Bradyrhizobium sp. USDA 4538]MCP1900696.1 hypothetical protein [Bradyrhizobium sp. USDA 4537]MCP1993648.1 hypothetical protein [Bradyrhizobium sp. USDA 4539]